MDNTRNRTSLILIPAIFVVAGILYFVFDPSVSSSLFPKCPFYLLTGLQCPGCGIQRAIHCLLHGDVVQAFHYNAFAIIVLPFLFLMLMGEWFNFRHWFDSFNRVAQHRYTFMVLVGLCLVWWIVRNLLGV